MQGKGHRKGRKCKQCKGHQCIHENTSDISQYSACKGISLAEQSMEILEKVLAKKEGLPEEILKLASKEELFQLGMDPVCIVAAMGHLDGIRIFVEAGTNCNDKRSSDGSTPLMLATQNRHIDVVQLLLTHSADVTAVNSHGNNAFLLAIKTGDAKLVNALWPYKGNLDINHQNLHGFTALHFAADKCWDACVQFLLANGADIDRQSMDGWTPLMLASMRGDVKVAERLISTGADLLKEDKSGYTAVCHSAEPDKADVVEFFLSKVVEQNIKEAFVKNRIDRIKSPMSEDELEDLLVDAVLPILQKLTDKRNFRDVLVKLKVLPGVMSVVQKHMKLPEIILLSIHIMCLAMYCKDTDSVDDRFVKQFIKSRGCEFCLKALKLHNDSTKRSHDLLASCIFPIIIASQTVDGKSWIEKNNSKISTYSFLRNHFNNPSCMEDGKQIWIQFWDSFSGIQLEQREKKMAELLEEEDRERNRKVKRRERKKQKRQRQQQVKQRDSTDHTLLTSSDFATNEAKETSNLSTRIDSGQMNNSNKSLLENDVTTDMTDAGFQNMKYKNTTKNAKSSKRPTKPKNFLNEVASKQCSSHAMSVVSQENIWVKVQNRKTLSQSDAASESENYSMSKQSESSKKLTTEAKSPEQSKKRWADIAKVQTSEEQSANANPANCQSKDAKLCPGAMMPRHCDPNFPEGDYEYDFPSLDNKPSPTRASPERQMYGVSNSCSPTLDHWYMDYCPSESSITPVSEVERGRFQSDTNIAESTTADKDVQNIPSMSNQRLLESSECGSHFFAKANNCTDTILNDSLSCSSLDAGTSKNKKRITVSLKDIENSLYKDDNADIIHQHDSLNKSYPDVTLVSNNNHQQDSPNDTYFDVTSVTRPPCVTRHNDTFSLNQEIQQCVSVDSSLANSLSNQFSNTTENDQSHCIANQSAIERESLSENLKKQKVNVGQQTHQLPMQRNDAEPEINQDWSIHDTMDMALLFKYKPNGFDVTNLNVALSDGNMDKCQITSVAPTLDSRINNLSKYPWIFADKIANPGAERSIYSQNLNAIPKTIIQKAIPQATSYCISQTDKLASTNYTFSSKNLVPMICQDTFNVRCSETKKTNVAIIQPMTTTTTSLKDQDVTKNDMVKSHGMNCYLGESLLRNVSNLQTQDDEICYPSSLSGESESQTSNRNRKTAFDIFPGFHDNAAVDSVESGKLDFGFDDFNKLAKQQLQQYYNEVKQRGPVYGSLYYHDIPFYASCLGISEEELEKSFVTSSDRTAKNTSPMAVSNAETAMENRNPIASIALNQTSNTSNILHMQCKEPYPYILAQEYATDSGRVFGANQPVQAQCIQSDFPDNMCTTNQIRTEISNCQVTNSQINGNGPKLQHVPPIKTEISNCQATISQINGNGPNSNCQVTNSQINGNGPKLQHVAPFKTVQPWIQRSVRWRQKLTEMRNLQASCMRQLGDILIPVNTEHFLVPYSDGSAILGFLMDGSEVLVHVIDVTVRTINSDILRSVTSPRTSQYFLIKYRTFAFENNCCYIAMDLPEYSLNEYLALLKSDAHSEPMTVNKLAWQFLKGLSSLHEVLGWAHGNMMPSNIFVDVEGKLILSEYSFAQPDSSKAKFHGLNAIEYDRSCWTPTEITTETEAYTMKSDLQVAGMILHYILSGGNHPYGEINLEIQVSIQQNWPKSTYISDEANGLINDMIVMPPAARPTMEEVLKHPYFWANEKRLRFVLIAGSDVLRDMKSGTSTTGGMGDTMIDIINNIGKNSIFSEWTSVVDHVILKEMRSFRQYKNTLVELVLFVYNCCLHFDKLSQTARDIIDEPCRYFLTTFPALFMAVFTAIKNSNRAERVCYKPFF